MTKKNFGDKLSKTVAASDMAMEERMSKLDKLFAPAPAESPISPSAPGPTSEMKGSRAGHELAASPKPPASRALQAQSRVVRDNFSMPEDDYSIIDELRSAAARAGRTETTKSSVLRAGLHALKKMQPEELLQVLAETERIKPGRKTQ